MRKMMMLLAAIAAVVAMMGTSALPAFANDFNNRCCDDRFFDFNRCCDDRFFDDDFDFDDCGLRCRHDDDFFRFRNTCNGPHQTIDLNTGEWIWVSC